VSVTVRIGVAMFPEHETAAGDVARCQLALLLAKRPPNVVFHRA
jgi:hypothetical protein